MTFKQNWEKTDQHYKVPPETISGMVALGFPKDKLASQAVISGGCANLNVKVVLEDQTQPYILRIYVRDTEAADREQKLSILLKEVIPIPQVFYVGDYEQHRFAITEFMPGITLRDLLLSDEPCDIEGLMTEVGEVLGRIQTIRFPKSGFFGKDLTIQAPITQKGYIDFAWDCLRHPTVIDKLGAKAISQIGSLLETHGSYFPDEAQNHLVHGDFDPANILVTNKKDRWHISGVLDWEFTFSGTPLTDVANMLRYAHQMPPVFQKSFLFGIKKCGVDLPEDWQLRIDLLNLLSLLDCLVRCSPDQRPNQCTDICNLIEEILNRRGAPLQNQQE